MSLIVVTIVTYIIPYYYSIVCRDYILGITIDYTILIIDYRS